MSEQGAWLTILGIGEEGLDSLTPVARRLLDQAKVLVGGERHLAMLGNDQREQMAWTSPFSSMVEKVLDRRGEDICILASGDPMCFGVGATFSKRIPVSEMLVVPGISSYSLACSRLGWVMMDVDMLTLHGRPLSLLHPHVQPGAKLLMLSENGTTPAEVASLLTDRGFGDSKITVLEHMGGEKEQVLDGVAHCWSYPACADLNTIAVECIATHRAEILPTVPGLPDDAFVHDGQLTKKIVRSATLSALMPMAGQVLWDLGAGCGSISIEWMRAARGTKAVAVERDQERLSSIAANAQALGTPFLSIKEGELLSVLGELMKQEQRPDAIFVGGGATSDGLFDLCWQALKPGGRFVANVVTLEGEMKLFEWHKKVGGELNRIAVSQASPIGPYHGWRAAMPVTQYAVTKKYDG
ncbi:precorrin-6Y C5,15-methyltransferase [Kiloniella litopenaei]|uniref:Precorrin-6Y C5,15-methyltransferase n=1 Tax=Kiloniella litopenaei TaxID=1549748 RepID=A0A0M2R7I8_9PROT|nr:bifunctional cobalt-precorrin-7 (C(5))-methyltransferase/cobalt-precorrin-6B (C(15))-methyltransferase [Kiloniella litopenaei]KKJ75985.1 precorrin-6Y C5,15-methyltransferase [Kiloniella litopenaei]